MGRYINVGNYKFVHESDLRRYRAMVSVRTTFTLLAIGMVLVSLWMAQFVV